MSYYRSNHDCFGNPTWAPDGAGGWIEDQAEPPLLDHAATIRDLIHWCPDVVGTHPTRKENAYRALDALVAELAEARRERDEADFERDQWETAAKSEAKENIWWQRAEAAEAENALLKAACATLIAVAAQYLDTDRGDLDGAIDAARAALRASGGSSTDGGNDG